MEKLQITKDVPCNYTGKNEFIIWDSEGVALCGVNNEDLAKLICNSINTYQQCEELPSELLRQNREMKEALTNLMNDIGGGVKFCGHDFSCNCAWTAAVNCLISCNKGKE